MIDLIALILAPFIFLLHFVFVLVMIALSPVFMVVLGVCVVVLMPIVLIVDAVIDWENRR